MEINGKPVVSVIIPTYNRAYLIAEAIQSVLDQSYQDFEIMVVDDGSTDNTREVVDGFKEPRIKYIYQENRGVSAARNTGIKASNGEYIALLDSDDMWLPENLELKVKLLDSYLDVALVSSDYYIFDSNTSADLRRFWDDRPYRYLLEIGDEAQQPMLARATLLTPTAVIVRRQVFSEVGYFDESLGGTDDWDMWFRILQRFPIRTINMPLARYRRHDAQFTTASFTEMYLAEVAMVNKAIRAYSLSKEDMKFIRKKLAGIHLGYGREVMARGKITLGREKILASIKVYPWYIRPYVYLAISILGSKGVLIVKSWKKWVKRFFTQHQTSSDSQSSDSLLKT